MFVTYTADDTKVRVNVDHILYLLWNRIVYSNDDFGILTPEQHDEIAAQLDALTFNYVQRGLLYKPSDSSPPVGEPLREIVNGALLQDFIKTKGRKD